MKSSFCRKADKLFILAGSFKQRGILLKTSIECKFRCCPLLWIYKIILLKSLIMIIIIIVIVITIEISLSESLSLPSFFVVSQRSIQNWLASIFYLLCIFLISLESGLRIAKRTFWKLLQSTLVISNLEGTCQKVRDSDSSR